MPIDISHKLYSDIRAYCDINGLNFDEFVEDTLKSAFIKIKYGERPKIYKNTADENKSESVSDMSYVIVKKENEASEIKKHDIEVTHVQKQEDKKNRKRKLN